LLDAIHSLGYNELEIEDVVTGEVNPKMEG